MTKNEILALAQLAGFKILSAGAETYRVEETINRILNGYGVLRGDCFVTPTVIVVSCLNEDGDPISIVKRVGYVNTDLEKMSLINDLSRRIETEHITPEEFESELVEIELKTRYKYTTTLFANAVIGYCFTAMFGGDFKESLSSSLACIVMTIIIDIVKALKLTTFFQNAIGGLIAVLVATLFANLGFYNQIHTVVIGSIMILVPGVMFTNAIRDTFRGDFLSGMTRAADALVTATGIAVGAALGFVLGGII